MHQYSKQILARYESRLLLFFQEDYFAQQGIFYSLRIPIQIKLTDLLEECMQNYPEVMYLLLQDWKKNQRKCSKRNHTLKPYSPFILENIFLMWAL